MGHIQTQKATHTALGSLKNKDDVPQLQTNRAYTVVTLFSIELVYRALHHLGLNFTKTLKSELHPSSTSFSYI